MEIISDFVGCPSGDGLRKLNWRKDPILKALLNIDPLADSYEVPVSKKWGDHIPRDFEGRAECCPLEVILPEISKIHFTVK